MAINFDVIIVDVHGVFNFGGRISQSTINCFKHWVDEGKKVYVLANTTSLNADFIKDYAEKGFLKGVHYNDVMTSGQLAHEDIIKGNLPFDGEKYCVIGTANLNSDEPVPKIFANSPYKLVSDFEECNFIYCGVPQLLDDEMCPYDSSSISDFVRHVQALVKLKKPLLVTSPEPVIDTGKRYVIRQGSIAELWKIHGGQCVIYGKPDTRIYDALLNRYCSGVDKSRVLMVGDTLSTDIKGAQAAGIKSALTIEGGVTEYECRNLHQFDLDDIFSQSGVSPDYVWFRVPLEPLF